MARGTSAAPQPSLAEVTITRADEIHRAARTVAQALGGDHPDHPDLQAQIDAMGASMQALDDRVAAMKADYDGQLAAQAGRIAALEAHNAAQDERLERHRRRHR